jgi:class I fructose-bisphosphate aldolase
MAKVKFGRLLRKGKAFYLAYDQGMEHGPEDFKGDNVNPAYVIDLAQRGKFNGIILQKGIAEKYQDELKEAKVPLIVKLNGKTKLTKGEPVSRQLCTVQEALDLGAKAVGYTIYIGSEYESFMLREFEDIVRQAHEAGIPAIAWIYPRGKSVKDPKSRDMLAYAARVGLEIGADMVKLMWNGKVDDLKWAVRNAGKVKVVVAGGMRKEESVLLEQIEHLNKAKASGRNVWQADDPVEIAGKIRKALFS